MDWKTNVIEMLPFIGGLIAVSLTWGLLALAKKLKLKIEKEQIMQWVTTVVDFVEEWAARKIKEAPESKPSGEEKAKVAIAAVKAEYPKLTDKQVEVLLGAAVARAPGVGATGEGTAAPKE